MFVGIIATGKSIELEPWTKKANIDATACCRARPAAMICVRDPVGAGSMIGVGGIVSGRPVGLTFVIGITAPFSKNRAFVYGCSEYWRGAAVRVRQS